MGGNCKNLGIMIGHGVDYGSKWREIGIGYVCLEFL